MTAGTSPRTLDLRELNRATLARQLLLERSHLSAAQALESLGGLQAQIPVSPYIALWSRLAGFRREDLASLIEGRKAVKATLQRATLHLVTVADYLPLLETLKPMFLKASASIAKQRDVEGIDFDEVLRLGREYLREPRSFAEVTAHFAESHPGADPGAIRYTLRTHLALVQVPVEGGWSYPGNPKFLLAEVFLGRKIAPKADLQRLVRSYLAAFGPASVADLQCWSGLSGLREPIAPFRSELETYRDEAKRELLDLPGQPLPEGDVPAPVRFLGELDSLVLAYDKRARVISEEHKTRIYSANLRGVASVLLDGFVGATWRLEKGKKGAVALVVEPFGKLTKKDRAAIAEEGEALLRFVEGGAKSHEVRFKE
jgi:hypothetical protein